MMKTRSFLFILLAATALLTTACKNESSAPSEEQEQELPPPPRPDAEIAAIDLYVDSLLSNEGLEIIEKTDDSEPGLVIVRQGFFNGKQNYYMREQSTTAFTVHMSSFFFRSGDLVHSRHKMMRKRCGREDEICLSETRQYYQAGSLIWSESRNDKFVVEGRTDLLGLEAFTMLDSLKFEMIPNLRQSDQLYTNEMIMSKDLLELIKQPMSTEEKMIKLE